jgi:hypothetical protein
MPGTSATLLRVVIPAGGVGANEAADCDAALALMRRVLKAHTLSFAPLSAE